MIKIGLWLSASASFFVANILRSFPFPKCRLSKSSIRIACIAVDCYQLPTCYRHNGQKCDNQCHMVDLNSNIGLNSIIPGESLFRTLATELHSIRHCVPHSPAMMHFLAQIHWMDSSFRINCQWFISRNEVAIAFQLFSSRRPIQIKALGTWKHLIEH